MKGIHFLNGSWVDADDLKISAFDLALTRGLAVFDTLRTHEGRPFALTRHLERFQYAIDRLSIQLNLDEFDIGQLIADGMSKNSLSEAVIRLNATMGINEGRLSSSNPNFYIMFLPLSLPDKSKYEHGQTLKSVKIPRTLPEIKTTNYIAAKLALEEGDKIGADEALYVDKEDNMLETTISNVFFLRGDKVITPKTGKILNGITRQLVIEMLRKQGEAVEERDVKYGELDSFDEVFACSTIKEIMAVTRIDDRQISDGLGEKTRRIMRGFKEFKNEVV